MHSCHMNFNIKYIFLLQKMEDKDIIMLRNFSFLSMWLYFNQITAAKSFTRATIIHKLKDNLFSILFYPEFSCFFTFFACFQLIIFQSICIYIHHSFSSIKMKKK